MMFKPFTLDGQEWFPYRENWRIRGMADLATAIDSLHRSGVDVLILARKGHTELDYKACQIYTSVPKPRCVSCSSVNVLVVTLNRQKYTLCNECSHWNYLT
jgi:porphobilinogen deaminase